jgi:hypothetical protein
MNSEEEFKDNLARILESKEFSFDEKDWEQAKKYIDDSRRKRRIPFYVIGALLIVGGLTAYYFIGDSPQSVQLVEKKEIVINEGLAPKKVSPEVSPAPLSPVVNPNPGTIESPAEAKQPVEKAKSSIKKAPEIKAVPETNTGNNENIAEPAPPAKTNTQPEKQTEPVAVNPTIISETENNEAVTNVNQTKAEKSNAPLVATAPVTKIDPPTPNGSEEVKINVAAVNTETADTRSTAVTSNTASGKEEIAASNVTPSETTKKEESVANPATIADTAVAVIAKPDTAAVIVPSETGIRSMLLSIEAGGAYLNGWRTQGTRDASGFNPVIGFNYYYPLTQNIDLSMGLQYTSVANLAAFSHTSKITKFTTGEESKVTVITPEKLHYMVAPLRVNYAVTPANVIGIGCYLGMLMDVTGSMETYDYKLNKKENIQVSKVSGYTEGFKTFDTQFSIFYRRHIYKRLYLNGELFMGATDVKDNKFFNSETAERNYGLRFSVIFNIFNR